MSRQPISSNPQAKVSPPSPIHLLGIQGRQNSRPTSRLETSPGGWAPEDVSKVRWKESPSASVKESLIPWLLSRSWRIGPLSTWFGPPKSLPYTTANVRTILRCRRPPYLLLSAPDASILRVHIGGVTKTLTFAIHAAFKTFKDAKSALAFHVMHVCHFQKLSAMLLSEFEAAPWSEPKYARVDALRATINEECRSRDIPEAEYWVNRMSNERCGCFVVCHRILELELTLHRRQMHSRYSDWPIRNQMEHGPRVSGQASRHSCNRSSCGDAAAHARIRGFNSNPGLARWETTRSCKGGGG